MSELRLHLRNGVDPIKFFCDNKRDFIVEKTSTGFCTIVLGNRRFYVRDYRQNYGMLNNIINFQKGAYNSELADFIKQIPDEEVEKESLAIENTLLYKGFNFDPNVEKEFKKVIKVDLNSAYWQTCRYMGLVDKSLYKRVSDSYVKSTRLMMAGTLGKTVMVTEYKNGERVKSYEKEKDTRRIVQHNIYNRVRKFVDELMIWAWRRDPSNFIGYYVDCIWFREGDWELLDMLQSIYNLKMEVVDLIVTKKTIHGKAVIVEVSETEKKPYDAQFRSNEFVKYQTLYNFTPDLQGININVRWQTPKTPKTSKTSKTKLKAKK